MLGKITSIFTTASSTGVALRYGSTIVGAILAILGVLGALSPEQVDELTRQMPILLSAIGGLVAAVVPIYATVTKSSSDKAAEIAKAVDEVKPLAVELMMPRAVELKTADPAPNPVIIVPAAQ